MSDLSSFLLQRIAEDEAAARAVQGSEPWATGQGSDTRQYWMLRVLADCEANRRIIEQCQEWLSYDAGQIWDWADRGSDLALARDAARRLLKLLALRYADHPDYREEWKP